MEHNNHTILIVDDNRELSFLHQEVLADKGYNVLTAATGAEALALIESRSIDLVILDLHLPDINGETLFGKVKRIKPDIKVIIMTGYEDVESYVKTSQLGAIDYLIKPVSPKGLINVLKKALS